MKKLLAIEWMKVKSYRTFWVLFVLFIVSMLGINYIYWYIKQQLIGSGDMGSAAVGNMLFGDFSFPAVFKTVSGVSSWLLYFPGFMVIFHTTNEYTFKTHRQNIIDGLQRSEFVKAKLGFAFLLALICTALIFLTSIFFGLITQGGYGITMEGLAYIGYFFVQSSVYILFAFMLSILVRKSALAVGIYFIYGILLDFLLSLWISKITGSSVGFYILPLQVSDTMNPNEVADKVSMFLGSTKPMIALGISVAWIIFYCWFPTRKFQQEDL